MYKERVYDMEKAEKEMKAISSNLTSHVLKEEGETDHSMSPSSSASPSQLSRNEEYVT